MSKNDEKILATSMQIILHSGDARLYVKEALDAILSQDFTLANSKIANAQKEITIAHKAQTDMIQEEAKGEKAEYSLLFAHAQDTLMTIYSELNIAKQMVKIFEFYEERLSVLEGADR